LSITWYLLHYPQCEEYLKSTAKNKCSSRSSSRIMPACNGWMSEWERENSKEAETEEDIYRRDINAFLLSKYHVSISPQSLKW